MHKREIIETLEGKYFTITSKHILISVVGANNHHYLRNPNIDISRS
jgi:hypothetical protein